MNHQGTKGTKDERDRKDLKAKAVPELKYDREQHRRAVRENLKRHTTRVQSVLP